MGNTADPYDMMTIISCQQNQDWNTSCLFWLVISFICNAVPMKESWLEIYKVPKDTWVKEIEAAVTTVAARSRKPTMVESTAPVS